MLMKVQSTSSKVQSPTTTLTALTEVLSFEDFIYLNNNEWNLVMYWELS